MFKKEDLLEKIIIDPKIMVGKPIIKGTRIPIQNVLESLYEGMSIEDIMYEYQITREDILACIAFASDTLEDINFAPISLNK